MKKVILLICCTILVLTLSSCTTYKLVVPVGLWQCDNPAITLDITTDEALEYYGIYVMEGEKTEILIVFGDVSNLLSIYDAIIQDENHEGGFDDWTYFCGHWEVKDDKLYFKLLPTWAEMHGIDEIIFTKIADYE